MKERPGYKDIIETIKGGRPDSIDDNLFKLLRPLPVSSPDEIADAVEVRFRYTGPGKWYKIIKEAESNKI